MVAENILRIIKALAADVELPAQWDEHLPLFCSVTLAPQTEFLAVQTPSKHYVVSIVDSGLVRSYLIEKFSSDSIDFCVRTLKGDLARFESASARSNSGQASSSQPSSHEFHKPGSQGDAGLTRDPNAPPGFEDEHKAQSSLQTPNHGIRFDPDADLYPPGGKYPQLGPLGPIDPLRSGDPHSLIGPSGEFRGPSMPGRGMHPEPFGTSKPPFIRYDPTSPF